MIENNIGRDGTDDETAALYSDHARYLYWSIAELLRNYRDATYPSGVNLYQNPKLRSLLTLHNLAQTGCGLVAVPYGDTGPNRTFVPPPARAFDRNDYQNLEFLYARSDAPDKPAIASVLRWMSGGDTDCPCKFSQPRLAFVPRR